MVPEGEPQGHSQDDCDEYLHIELLPKPPLHASLPLEGIDEVFQQGRCRTNR
jgi:hypothetical protein